MLRIGYARTLRTQRIDHRFAYALHLLELWRNELISCDVAESEAGLPHHRPAVAMTNVPYLILSEPQVRNQAKASGTRRGREKFQNL